MKINDIQPYAVKRGPDRPPLVDVFRIGTYSSFTKDIKQQRIASPVPQCFINHPLAFYFCFVNKYFRRCFTTEFREIYSFDHLSSIYHLSMANQSLRRKNSGDMICNSRLRITSKIAKQNCVSWPIFCILRNEPVLDRSLDYSYVPSALSLRLKRIVRSFSLHKLNAAAS